MTDKKYITPEFVQGLIEDPGILGPAIIELAHNYLMLLKKENLQLGSEDLMPGDVVRSTGSWTDKTVDTIDTERKPGSVIVHWTDGGSTRYAVGYRHSVFRKEASQPKPVVVLPENRMLSGRRKIAGVSYIELDVIVALMRTAGIDVEGAEE